MVAGVVTRLDTESSDLRTFRLRVKKVIRGPNSSTVEHRLLVVTTQGTDTSRLRRGQTVLVAGVPSRDTLFTSGDPVEYSRSAENAVLSC